jgi:hypothetical protein
MTAENAKADNDKNTDAWRHIQGMNQNNHGKREETQLYLTSHKDMKFEPQVSTKVKKNYRGKDCVIFMDDHKVR